jgi:molybdenum cofactor biosynthesis enzyme MoaA
MSDLIDSFGRKHNNLRISVTDRCNLRCTYCMPAEGLDWLPGEKLLGPDEVARLLRIAVTPLGITRVRFTGASRWWPSTSKTSSPPPPHCGRSRRSR